MSRTARASLTLALLAAIAGFAWWLLRSAADETGAVRPRAPEASVAPRADTDAAPALPDPVASANATELRTAAAPAAAAALDVSADFSGRVVDERGRPVPGALVVHWPSIGLRVRMKIGAGFSEPVVLSRLEQVRTDADGRFRLGLRDEPPGRYTIGEPGRGPVSQGAFDSLVPSLAVLHADFEVTLFPCRGWTGGPFNAGELVLLPGASAAGVVVDEAHRPLAGVSVAPPPFQGRSDPQRAVEWDTVSKLLGVVTGADGRFVLDSLWGGPTPIGFTQAERNGLILTPVLQAGQTTDLGEVVLESGASIEGVVRDAQGAPVAGARVLARPDGAGMNVAESDQAFFETTMSLSVNGLRIDVETRTDAEGRFLLVGLATKQLGSELLNEPTVFSVVAEAEGFEPTLQREVKPDAEPLALVLSPEGSLVVTVRCAGTQEVVPGLVVKAVRELGTGEDKWSGDLAVSSGADELRAAGLAPPFAGVYLVHRAGRQRNELKLSAPGFATQGFVLPGVVPGERKSVVIELPRESRLAGRVLDPEKQPVADALVRLVLPETLRVQLAARETHTDAQGRFAFDTLQRGDWAVNGSAPGFVPTLSPRVTVKPESVVEDLELVLTRAGTIEGVVLQRGAPLAGVVVRVGPPGSPAAGASASAKASLKSSSSGKPPAAMVSTSVQTDTAGRFRFDSLAPGVCLVRGPPGIEQTVEVAAGQTVQLTLEARTPPRIRGQVLDARGAVAGASIKAEQQLAEPGAWRNEDSASTDASGRYELVLSVPGRYRVKASAEDHTTPVTEIDAPWDAELLLDLRFASGTLGGFVLDAADRAPVPVAVVSLWGAKDSTLAGWSEQGDADATGHFLLDHVPEGALKLSVSHPDYCFLGPQEAPALGEESTLLLQRAGVLQGVITAAGELGEGLRLRCVPLDAPGGRAWADVEDDGRFQRRQLAPGRWRCELVRRVKGEPESAALASAVVSIVAGETAVLELPLP
jgi:protocatechuate 3,4-dioxygenase beta subunit